MTDDTIRIPVKMKRKRRLKVAFNQSQSEPGRKVAAIRFSGFWLEDVGFEVGKPFDLIINEDRSLTLRLVTDEESAQEQAARDAVTKTND
jgi:hypothetical protein